MYYVQSVRSEKKQHKLSVLSQYTNFSHIIGHQNIIRILESAVQKGSMHAFLFSGTRGIGKTSLARIVAKKIICDSNNICGTCQSCIDNIDIIEIDGATYTGVDNIRSLIEQSTFRPMISKNKVFIIDEVHMLSNSAFNALLKTIEEPSHFSYFIFATTEIEKIPKTIISRCLTCNLNPLSIEEIELYITGLLSGIKYNEKILKCIAKHADGSIRDAKFLVEKILLLKENNIEIEDIRDAISFLPSDIDLIIKYISSSEYKKAISVVKNILCDPKILVREISNGIYQSDIGNERKVSLYNIAINTLPLLKYFNRMQVVEVMIMKMCSKIYEVDILLEKAKELFPEASRSNTD